MSRFAKLQPNAQGIVLVIISIFCFTLMDAIGKALVTRYHPIQVVWWRNSGQFLLLFILFNHRIGAMMRTRHLGLHVLRSLAQVAAALLFFTSIRYIGLAEATAIMDVNPVLITLGAAFFFGERLGPRRLAGVGIALIGSMIVIRPGSDVFAPEALYALAAAFGYATFALVTRRVGREEDPWTAMLWSPLIGAVLLGALMIPLWVPPLLSDLPLFLGLALLGTIAQFFMIRAFSLAEASVIAPFGYVGLIFATLWGMIFFDAMPDFWTVVGAAIIVGAGLYIWHRETLLAKGRLKETSA